MPRRLSLRWQITLGLLVFQILALVVSSIVTIGVALYSSPMGIMASPYLGEAVVGSLGRNETGALQVVPNSKLQEFIDASPGIWAIAQTELGERAMLGEVPAGMYAIIDMADALKTVAIEGQDGQSTARFERLKSPLGMVAVLSGGGGYLPVLEVLLLIGHLAILLPVVTLIILTLIGVPLFIRWCLRPLRSLTGQIDRIDFAARGIRLVDDRMPREILPVVSGMNEALQRIDAGVEMTERFFMNAAHELRTPIAILQVRLDAFPPGPEHEKLRNVVRRLTVVVNQLLDIERFRQNPMDMQLLDLRSTVSNVVADLAPYAIAEGYSIEMDEAAAAVWVVGDKLALDRMVINLVQNAIQHAGKWGVITVRLTADGVIEVQDQGPGIPWDRRERIFEPFYRVNPQGLGSGLGLKMVRDIARAHRGEAALADSSPAGSRFMIRLPVVSARDMHAGIRDGRYLTPAE